jgi:hypothetical protein
METNTKTQRVAGRVATGLAALFLIWDGAIKLLAIPPVVEAFTRLGLSPDLARAVGTLELLLVAAHLAPRLATVGAVLLTGFLGGAVVLHVRVADPLLSHVLFPVYVGAILWAGLLLRRPALRALLRGA